MHLELLREKMRTPDDDFGRHMDIIGNEIHRLDRVVKTLADFNRPIEPRFIALDLRRLVEDVTLLAAPDAERTGVKIESNPGVVALHVKADSDLLKQALLNVVLNGVQSMESGGTLALVARSDENSATIEVRDQGKGIAPEIRDKVFNLFFTTKEHGTGIGLAMSYRVMQMHGGSLSFDSAVGTGTVFHLTLPLAARQVNENKEVMKTM